MKIKFPWNHKTCLHIQLHSFNFHEKWSNSLLHSNWEKISENCWLQVSLHSFFERDLSLNFSEKAQKDYCVFCGISLALFVTIMSLSLSEEQALRAKACGRGRCQKTAWKNLLHAKPSKTRILCPLLNRKFLQNWDWFNRNPLTKWTLRWLRILNLIFLNNQNYCTKNIIPIPVRISNPNSIPITEFPNGPESNLVSKGTINCELWNIGKSCNFRAG